MCPYNFTQTYGHIFISSAISNSMRETQDCRLKFYALKTLDFLELKYYNDIVELKK